MLHVVYSATGARSFAFKCFPLMALKPPFQLPGYANVFIWVGGHPSPPPPTTCRVGEMRGRFMPTFITCFSGIKRYSVDKNVTVAPSKCEFERVN